LVMENRRCGTEDVPAVAETMARAFHSDPLWGWAFPDPSERLAQHEALWTLFLRGSIDHGWVWATEGYEAASLWIPPDLPELTEPYASHMEPLLDELLGDRAKLLLEVFECFEAAHPRDEPHYYLSLLATHPDHRGQGLGMHLMRANLDLIDIEHRPAYLESTNPANNDRYRAVGFEPLGEFQVPQDGPPVMSMWRTAR
jgi:GNAT superfamily N-acetyltransferase